MRKCFLLWIAVAQHPLPHLTAESESFRKKGMEPAFCSSIGASSIMGSGCVCTAEYRTPSMKEQIAVKAMNRPSRKPWVLLLPLLALDVLLMGAMGCLL